VVGDYINTMKTTFDFIFDLHQAVKQHGYTVHSTHKHRSQEKLNLKSFSLITLKLVIGKKLANNQNFK